MVHRKDVQPVEMDIATSEFFIKEREKSTISDAKHVMPVKQIPDLNWKFEEDINQTETIEAEEAIETVEAVTAVETIEAVEMVEILETVPETICTTETSQETEEQQGKHLPYMPTPAGSTTNNGSTKPEIQSTSTKEKTQIPCTTEQATQITPTTKQAIQTTLETPQVNNSIVTKFLSLFRPVADTAPLPASNYGLQF